jgi:hypothetical protein
VPLVVSQKIAVVTVRREKALDFSGCNSRPGTGSLHPVAIEAAAEATKLSELSMERVAWRLGVFGDGAICSRPMNPMDSPILVC